MNYKNSTLAVIGFWLLTCTYAQTDTLADYRVPSYSTSVTTADVLQKRELFFSPMGWMAYGITPSITLEIDWKLAIGFLPAGSVKINLFNKK